MQATALTPATDCRSFWFFDTLVRVRVAATDGNEGVSILEHLAPPGNSAPTHVHDDEDEIFHILEGSIRFRLADKESVLGKGDTAIAPRGVPHTYRVESADGARWLTVTCNKSFEQFVRATSRPAGRDALPPPAAPPSAEAMNEIRAIANRHGIEFVGPPLS